jgi:hypothetical protein
MFAMKNGWLIAAVVFGCSVGGGLAACGSSSTPVGTGASTSSSSSSSTSTSGTTTSSSSGNTSSSSSSGAGGSTSSSSSSGTCEAASTLHPPTPVDAGFPDFYCPFSGDGGTGSTQYCAGGGTMECCETAADAGVPASCMAVGSASCPASSTVWGCDDPSECPAATPVCCAVAYSGKTVTINETAGCTDHYASGMGGTACMTAAACTGVVMCTADSQCPAGKTCLPFRKAGNQVGGCQ